MLMNHVSIQLDYCLFKNLFKVRIDKERMTKLLFYLLTQTIVEDFEA